MTDDSLAGELRDLNRRGLAKLIAIVCVHDGYRPALRTAGDELTVLKCRSGGSPVEYVYWIDCEAAATPRRLRSFANLRRRKRIGRAAAVTAGRYDQDVRDAAETLDVECLDRDRLADLVASRGLELYVSDLARDESSVDLSQYENRSQQSLLPEQESENVVYLRNSDW